MSDSTLAPGSKILVTGASGFIGIHVVKSLLEAGFKVVGTVRSASKGEYIKNLFKDQPFEFVIVEDIGKEGAFDEAVKGVDGVAHTASPFHIKAKNPEELIRPAVDGTIGVLSSVTRINPAIKRVVVTSSVAALEEPKSAPYVRTEADWNEFSVSEVEEKGDKTSPIHSYLASKTLAEQAAWKYVEEHKIPLVTLNPPLVFGPILHEVDKVEHLNTSVGIFWDVIDGKLKESDLPGGGGGDCIDVRELAEAHVLALTVPEAVGNRFIISQGPFCKQQLSEGVLAIAPETPNVPKGKAGAVQEANDLSKIVTSSGAKAEKILGIKYRSVEETVKDMYHSLERFIKN